MHISRHTNRIYTILGMWNDIPELHENLNFYYLFDQSGSNVSSHRQIFFREMNPLAT